MNKNNPLIWTTPCIANFLGFLFETKWWWRRRRGDFCSAAKQLRRKHIRDAPKRIVIFNGSANNRNPHEYYTCRRVQFYKIGVFTSWKKKVRLLENNYYNKYLTYTRYDDFFLFMLRQKTMVMLVLLYISFTSFFFFFNYTLYKFL